MLPKYLSALAHRAPSRHRVLAYLRKRSSAQLYVNSFYLMGGTVASAGIGFVFWMLAARSASAADVGIATAAIASVNLLIAISDLGLATALIRYAASERAETIRLINTAIAIGWLCICLVTTGFLIGLPLWSPGLISIRNSVQLAGAFFAFTVFSYILALQDAVMLSQGRASHVFWRNLACNIPSPLILLPLIDLIGGYSAIFVAYTLPNMAVGLVVSCVILPARLEGYRFFGRIDQPFLAKISEYGLTNHLGNILWGMPSYLLPLIAINTLTAQDTGYFFMNWTIVNFVLIAPRMISLSLFTHVSRNNKGIFLSSLQSLILILTSSILVVLVLWFKGEYILGLFGVNYVRMALLHLLLLSIVPFSVNSVFFVVLRVQKQLKQLILFSALTAGSVLVFALALVPVKGAEGLAAGWLLGHLLSAMVVAGIAARRFWMNRLATL